MIKSFSIKNYKSILDQTVELGRINVFIGENGSGKTNILEAMGMAAAALADRLKVEDLYARGIRVAKPSITLSSFLNRKRPRSVELKCGFLGSRVEFSDSGDEYAAKAAEDVPGSIAFSIRSPDSDEIDAEWQDDAPFLPRFVKASTGTQVKMLLMRETSNEAVAQR